MSGIVKSFFGSVRYLASFLVPHKVEEIKSEVSGKLEVYYSNGQYLLDTTSVNYSFGGLHTIFQKAFARFKIKDRDIKNVLILGFGSGSVASILQKEYGKEVAITGVEKDEAVIQLAKKYFSVDQYKNLSLECADAYDYVVGSGDGTYSVSTQYDMIVVDVFVDLLVPEKVQGENFITSLNKLLSPNGILFYNYIARSDKTRDAGAKLYKNLTNLIGNTEWVRLFARSTENWVFVCDRGS